MTASSTRTEVSEALHDLGAATKHAANEVKEQVTAVVAGAVHGGIEAATTTADKAKDLAATSADKAKDLAATSADKAKDLATSSADKVADSAEAQSTRARQLVSGTADDLRKRGRARRKDLRKTRRKALKAAHKTRQDAVQAATSRFNDATAAALDMAGKATPSKIKSVKIKPAKKRRGGTLVKVLAVVAVAGGVVAAVRTLRPKQTARTGSSIPPKVRPVPTPPDAAVGGLPSTGEDATKSSSENHAPNTG